MSYIVKIGTTEALWNDNNPIPEGYVEYVGDITSTLVWDGAIQNLREKTTVELLADLKLAKITELEKACRQAIESGFTSNALGSPHIYGSSLESQLNLVGATMAGKATQKYTCVDVATQTKARRVHNTAQLNIVFSDGVAYKDAQLDKLETKVQQVENATTESEVNGVTW